MEGDDRVPAAGVGGGEVLDQAGDLPAGGGGDVGPSAEDGLQRGGRLGVVVLVGAGQGDDEAAGDVVGQAVHVVDLRGQEQLADVGEDGVGHDAAAAVVDAVDRGRHPAGEEALDDGDELDHGVADVAVAVGVEAVGLHHEGAGADQQVAEAGPGADARVAVVGGVGDGGQPAASTCSPARKTRSWGTNTSSKMTTPVDCP